LIELEKPNQIGDRGAVLPGALGELLLRELKLVAQALEGACLLNRVQVFALEVFDQGHFDRQFFGNLAQDYRDTLLGRPLRGAPATFPGNELIAKADAPDEERLDNATRTNRLRELLKRLLAKTRARLIGARIDEVDIDLGEAIG
jgi:hypothetical protein